MRFTVAVAVILLLALVPVLMTSLAHDVVTSVIPTLSNLLGAGNA
ncbi:MAG: hypothetical protein ACRDX8_05425 [Acidimicrobiales bacterium]